MRSGLEKNSRLVDRHTREKPQESLAEIDDTAVNGEKPRLRVDIVCSLVSPTLSVSSRLQSSKVASSRRTEEPCDIICGLVGLVPATGHRLCYSGCLRG